MRPSIRRSWILWRYILRAHVGPFFFSFGTLMFLFLLQFVMKFADQLVGKGLSAWIILELIGLNLAWMVVLAVPMSVLVATLMAFGDLSSKNEITAMKATGMSLYRMMTPVFVAGLLVGAGLIYFNNDVLPDANHELRNLTQDIRRKKPTLTLVNGVFSQEIQGYSILVRKSIPNTSDLRGVTIFDYTDPTTSRTITGERGRVSFSPDFKKLIMDLTNGEIHELDLQKSKAYRRIRFEHHRIAMAVENFDFSRSEGEGQRGDREMSAAAMRIIVDSLNRIQTTLKNEFAATMRTEMLQRLDGKLDSIPPVRPGVTPIAVTTPQIAARAADNTLATLLFKLENLDRQSDGYLVEIYKKYSIPTACIVFVLVGVPLGIMARKGGFGVAASLSLGFFVLYWACLIGGEKLADRDIVQPAVGMWIANVLIGVVGCYLTYRTAKETVYFSVTIPQRFIPRRWRTRLEDEQAEPEVER